MLFTIWQKCWHFDVHVFKKLISIVCFVAPLPVSRCLVLCFRHHALILATSSHNAILPYLSFKLVTSTYHIAFSPIYPLTLPLPWSNRVQLGSDRWLNQPQQALSPIRNLITLSAIVCWTTAKCHFRTVSTPRQPVPPEACVEKGAKSCLIDLSKRKNFDHLSFVKSGPSHIELDGCVAGTQIVTILDYTSVTSVRMLNEKMIWEWPSTNDFVSHVRLGVICNM